MLSMLQLKLNKNVDLAILVGQVIYSYCRWRFLQHTQNIWGTNNTVPCFIRRSICSNFVGDKKIDLVNIYIEVENHHTLWKLVNVPGWRLPLLIDKLELYKAVLEIQKFTSWYSLVAFKLLTLVPRIILYRIILVYTLNFAQNNEAHN